MAKINAILDTIVIKTTAITAITNPTLETDN